MTMFFEIIMME